MKKQIANLLFLLLLVQGGLSQPTQTVRGRVFDQVSLVPLLGANVFILEAGPITGVISDENGIFTIDDVPVGRYSIMVSHLGYEPMITRDVIVGTGKEVFLEVGMREFIVEMEGVDVLANISKDQTINPMAGISARSFTVEETEKFPGSWGDPARMASNYAGVFPNGDIYNYIVVRGNSPNGLIWRMDGIPIPNPNHFDVPGARGGPISIINNKQLAQSDFMTSAFPAEYSNGVSGVFDLQLRNGNNQNREYVAEVGLMGIDLGAEGPISRKTGSSYMVNFRASLLGLVDELLWVEALPKYNDLTFKANFPTKKGKFSVFGFGGISRIRGVGVDSLNSSPGLKRQITEESGAKTGAIGAKYLHFLGSRSRLVTDLSFSTSRPFLLNDSLINDVVSRPLVSNQYREDRILLASKIITKINARNSLNFGFTLENNFVNYQLDNEFEVYPVTGGDSLVKLPGRTFSANDLLLFRGHAEWKHSFSNSVILYTGLNYMQFFMNNSSALEPRTNFRWTFAKNQTLSIGYGLHSQVHPFFHYLTRSYTTDDPYDRENFIETNRNLDFTRSHHVAAGYDLAISEDLRLKVEVYHQELFSVPVEQKHSYFSLLNIGAGEQDPFYDSLVNEGTGMNRGIELTLEKFLSNRYYFLLTASFLDSKYKGSNGILRNTAFNSDFNVNGIFGYEFPLGERGLIDASIRFVAAGGRRIVPLNVEKTLEEGKEIYMYEKAFDERLADYFRLDGRLGYKVNGLRARHEFAVDLTNLTNKQNEWSWRYDELSNEIVMIYQQGFFPFLYYRINF